ncbi:MAG: GNAT family N-acetyltransferase [Chloroflexi bacterium]|nr:GNAT family N-acetyltransferase [Chloroflexota bacterium]
MSRQRAPLLETDRLSLVWLDRAALAAVVEGDPGAAERQTGAVISVEWIEASRRLCALRLEQMQRDPAQGPWLLRAVVHRTAGAAIGHVGFHGALGVNGLRADDAVELGYSILPAYRGQGFATEAAAGLMDWAVEECGVRRFLASVGPANTGSIRVLEKLSFVEVARVWDDEDGEEIVYERIAP